MIQKLILLSILIFQATQFELRQSEQGIDVLLTYSNEMINSQNDLNLNLILSETRKAKITRFIGITFNEFDMRDKDFTASSNYQISVEPPIIKYTSDDSYVSSFDLILTNIINPSNPGQKNIQVGIFNGQTMLTIFLVIEIKGIQLKSSILGKGVTFERSSIQLSFELDFFSLLQMPIMFVDLQIQLEFPVFTSLYISCSDFIGLSQNQFCRSKGNIIYVQNRDREFLYNESKQSFIIHNFSFPSNLEIYTANLKIFEEQNKIAEDQFTFSAYAPAEIERIIQTSTNCYAAQQTLLKLFLDSQQYILSKSDLQITLSQKLLIEQIIINDIKQSFVQNDKVIYISQFNDQQLDQFKVKVELQFINLEYKSNVTFSIQINKISPSLKGNFIYSIQPNEYKNFIVTRDTEIVDEETNLYINIELQNPIINGEIHIQFPQELNLTPSLSKNLNGQSFQFTFRIKNPSTICQTNRFESQAYQNNQFREQLYKNVILIQQPNQIIQVQQISFSNEFTLSKSNLQISLKSEFGIKIQFEKSINLNDITCQNCLKLDSSTIQLLKNTDVIIKGIETPRLAKESNFIIQTYENQCQKSQFEQKLLFKPNKFKIVPEVITKKLNQLNQWLFTFELPCDVLESDKLKIIYPSSLLMNEPLKCQILHINQNQFDCNSKIINLPPIQKKQVMRLLISQPKNPIKPVLIEWQFILVDKQENQIAIFISQFQDWEYQLIQNSMINLIDYKFLQMKEALLRFSLQDKVDQILYDGNIIIFCENCQQQQNQSVIITQEGQKFLEIPFRFFTVKNQYIYQFSYKLTTFYQGIIKQQGNFKQTISLYCSTDCSECESFEKCTICKVGYLHNFSCFNECPISYYGLNHQCYPCSIGQCTKCVYLDQEICLECNSNLDLYLNQCVNQDYFINENITNQTNNQTEQKVGSITVNQVLKLKYNFPGILLIIFLICLFTLIVKIQNYSSISKTILFSLFSVLENGIGIFIFIYFLIYQLFDLAFLSLSLLIYQIILQVNCLLQLKTYITFDLKYQQYKKDHLSVKIVFWISCGLNYIFFIIQTSKLNKNPQWNCKWQYKNEVLRQIANSLRQSLVYSILQITIVITSILELQQIQTTFLEILSVNIINIGLNFYHQYKYNSMNKRVLSIE
ncbi:unnamed protein product [Paramecium sonneborni]|uniref:MtA protein n=1 Tax=Paramecium sonneborni TaxID=65129 RepID=A0A8S1P270_9CILI|nr:unnamed protein product [Paramecium sonneborni]